MQPDLAAAVETVRAFNRAYTRQIDVIGDHHLGSPYNLAEARIIYELANREHLTATDLSGDLGLDPGYLSRTIKSLEKRGILARTASPSDARRRELALTPAGQKVADDLRDQSREKTAGLLQALPRDDRTMAVATMARLTRHFAESAPAPILLRPHRIGDLGWILERQARFYHEELGWDSRFETLVARIIADFAEAFDPACEIALIAEQNGLNAGSVMVVRGDDPGTAKLRLLYVEPFARGQGLGRQLVDAAIRFSREHGYQRLTLWTNDPLTTARGLYERAGFTLVEESEHSDFGPAMKGQYWHLPL
ncbi:putative acetyltransferase [Hartmannibacter diazotrophicus]|uniref:Putative acetyltransferase n=1 Tax=Hartmannibacter diazotrophicus TaxID=1482074 RepID=A0A2C9D7G6_9HYPH|nr:helix-turn-helix domain-containing GNAT family N-acetyltransferase [Hartmannibacter diazotrophicus]SON56247.1 putative acetyltransferase [Hartmannibacter diazotrophicus]